MRSSHSLDRLETAFDDDRLVANAGLLLPATLAQHLGLQQLVDAHLELWSVDTQDWRRPGEDQIASHALSSVRPGAIVLMHDGGGERSRTIAALDTVLDGLTGRGYAFGLLCS